MFDFMDLNGLVGFDGLDGLGDSEPMPTVCGFDMDGDGIVDTYQEAVDADGDGIVDMLITTQGTDTNGDGYQDTIVTGYDTNFDNTPEFMQSFQDLDGDGIPDFYSETYLVDTDADGIADSLLHMEDMGADGIFETSGIIDLATAIDYIDETIHIQNEFDDAIDDIPAYDGVDMQNFDPEHYDPSTVVGDPAAYLDNFHPQVDGGSCAVVAQEFILDNVLGRDVTEQELCELAYENGWFEYGPNGGTKSHDVGNLLEAYGMNVERYENCSISDIENALSNGGNVIVGVDANEIWDGGENDNGFGPGLDPNHAIQVIGIDYSNPDEPMVIVNDSGIQDGCGAMVPMDVFVGAWNDSGSFMVEAY